MSYINWVRFAENQDVKPIKNIPEGTLGWKDEVTGTQFYISKHDYEGYFKQVVKDISGKKADEIVNYLDRQLKEAFPYRLGDKVLSCTLRDAAQLFVLFSYIYNCQKDVNKENLREGAYRAFFSGNQNEYPEAWEALKLLFNKSGTLKKDTNIKILKGSAYKIKKYYLENNDLKDMRGASTLLTYVGENKIPEKISREYITECMIYAGGGNVFCVLPASADNNIAYQLEQLFMDYTLSVQCAFYLHEEISLTHFLTSYKSVMARVEEAIGERKKLRIYNSINPITPFLKNQDFEVNGECIPLQAEEATGSETCMLCKIREGKYKLKTPEGLIVCGSCLHKHMTGAKEKVRNLSKYERFANQKIEIAPRSVDDIGDYIAVVYGDGNNMGAIVQAIDSISGMMYFSRKTSQAAERATFKALNESCKNNKFEIVAVGGDDIFIIVPSDTCISFAARLIELFNQEFENLSADEKVNKYTATLSVGVCIGKSSSPIRLMLNYAEEVLKSSKKVAKENRISNCDNGSLDFLILDGTSQNLTKRKEQDDEPINFTLRPYSLSRGRDMIKLVQILKSSHDVKTSNLHNLKDGFAAVESDMEGKLFYAYDQVRNKNRLQSIFSTHKISGLEWDLGYFKALKCVQSHDSNELYSPWGDILDLWDYCGGDEIG
ncbi:MAG: hypothetical protein N3B21_05970 [Clostridia bacterium]|nr:hypothetical protein [Clostridia bacterium]